MFSPIPLLLLATAYAVDVAGVAPQDLHLYEPDHEHMFACLSDPSIRIPFSQVNDDYCDCPDGSDEPGTAACANGRFWCAGSEQYIPSRLVRDGACDYDVCCDGSDEAPGLCPDRCAEVKAKQAALRAAELEFLREGARLRQEMVDQAQNRKEELARSVKHLEARIKDGESELERKQQELVEAEQQDSALNLDPESVKAATELRHGIQETHEQLEVLHDHFMQLRDAYGLLNSALETMSEEYNPNFNDPAVKEAIKAWKAHASPPLYAPATRNLLDDIELLDSIKLASDTEAAQQADEGKWGALWSELLPPLISRRFSSMSGHGPAGPKVQIVQERIDELKQRIEQDEKQLKLDAKLLSLDEFWGPDEIGRSAENLCVSTQRGDFKYEACLFGTAVQLDGRHKVELGRSTGLKENGQIDFVGGNRCPNNKERSVTMHLECGHTTEAYSVEETEVCHYVILAKSPIACTLAEPKKITHDEL